MKKILFAIAIVLTLGLTANAQGTDGFFKNWDNSINRGFGDDDILDISNPGIVTFGESDNTQAPLGSGLLVLTALGAGYVAVRKKRRQRRLKEYAATEHSFLLQNAFVLRGVVQFQFCLGPPAVTARGLFEFSRVFLRVLHAKKEFQKIF